MTENDNPPPTAMQIPDADIVALRLSLVHSPVPSAMLDRQLRYLTANAPWLRQFELDEDDISGRCHFDVFPELGDDWRQICQRALDGDPSSLEGVLPERDDRSKLWLHWEIRPFYRADESIGGLFLFAFDISAPMQHMKTLGQQERLFEALFNEGPVGISVLDKEARLRRANKTLQRILGYEETELLGRHFSELTHPDDVDAALDRQARMNSGAMGRFDIEKRYLHKDGSAVHANVIVTKVRSKDDDIGAYIGIVRDITRRKQAEETLRDSELLFRTLFEHAPVGIAILGKDDRFQRVNAALEHLLGYSDGEFSGRHFSEFIHPEDLSHVEKIQAGEVERFEVEKRYIHKDGSVIEASSTVADVGDGPGGFRLAIMRDITAQKQAERALRESERLFRTLFERSPLGIFLADANQQYLRANAALERMLGYSQEEILGGKYTKFTHPDDLEESNALTASVLKGEQEFVNVDRRYLRKDGSTLYANTTLTTVRDETGRPEYYLAMAIDISERLRIQAAMQRGQRLQAVGEVAGMIAHDFNNLLAVVIGNLELAKSAILEPLPTSLVDRALQAAIAGASFNRRLLSLTNLGDLVPVDVDINERISNIFKLLEYTLGEKIEIETRLAGGLRPNRIDPGEFDSAIINMCSNARDAMPEGGHLLVTTEQVTIGETASSLDPEARSGTYNLLCLSDTGIGMSEATVRHATEPFFTTKPQGRGTGLGLTSVDKFVRDAGGFLRIESRPGGGTTISLYLPSDTGKSALCAPSGNETDIPYGDGELVLVVEDVPELREIILQRLERLGYAVVEAADAGAAIALLSKEDGIDLVFSDVLMPGGMNGYELAGWIAAHRPDVKVLLASGYHDTTIGNQPEDRLWPFLAKPFTFAELARATAHALASGVVKPA